MQQRIMDAATTLFSQKGYYQTSMDDVAALADVAKGTLYYHFKNKSQLFCETAVAGIDFVTEQVGRIIEQDAPPQQTAERILSLFVDICVDYSGLTDMIMNEMSAGIDADVLQTVRQAKQRLLRGVVQVLDEGMHAGAIRPCDSHCVADALISFVYAYCKQAFASATAARADVARQLSAIVMRGLLL